MIQEEETKELPTDLPKEGQEMMTNEQNLSVEKNQADEPEFDIVSEHESD